MPKLPLPPAPSDLAAGGEPAWVIHLPDRLWRVRFTRGDHPTRWDEFRTFGPLPSGRFDPHEQPPREQPEGVLYTAADWPTCLAEVFQYTRIINTRWRAPFITGIQLTRQLHIIDLRGDWPLTTGASHHINTGRKDYCRAWARALRGAWPHADGLASTGINSGTVITLFNPARNSLAAKPFYDRPLADDAHQAYIAAAAKALNYDLI